MYNVGDRERKDCEIDIELPEGNIIKLLQESGS